MTTDNALDVIQHASTGGMDSSIPFSDNEKTVLDLVDTVSQQAIESDSPHVAFDAMKSLLTHSRITGLALARFFYVMKYQWKNFSMSKTVSLEEYVQEELGLTKTTFQRYFRVQQMLVSGDVPSTYMDRIVSNGIKSLIPIGKIHNDGYDIDTEHWAKFAQAENEAAVRKVCKEITGKPEKTGTLHMEMEQDGSLYVWKDGVKKFYGHLNVDDQDADVQIAISRTLGDKIMTKE